MPTAAYINKFVKPFISQSTPKTLEVESIRALFLGFPGDHYNIKLKKPQGEIISLGLTHAKPEKSEFYPAIQHQPLFEYKPLSNNIAYIALNSFNNAKIDTEFLNKLPKLKTASAIIIDLRNNGGGSGDVALNIAQYFIQGDIIYNEKVQTRRLIAADRGVGSFFTPADTVNGKPDWGLTKQQVINYYNKYIGDDYFTYENRAVVLDRVQKLLVPTVILTSYATASAAEDFLIFTDGQKQITRIGENSNGSTGQPLQVQLPGGGSAWICTKKTFYPDGREFIGIGIKPNIKVVQTVQDFIKNKDVVLQKAVEFLSKN